MSNTTQHTEKQRQRVQTVQAAISGSADNSTFVRDLLTKEEFKERLGLESTRMVDELIRKRKIPVVRLGWRTVRIPWLRALQALTKLEVRALGQ